MTAARRPGEEFGGPRAVPVNLIPPPPPPPPPLYPQCMRHQHHRCFYNRNDIGCRPQQPQQQQYLGPEPVHHHHQHHQQQQQQPQQQHHQQQQQPGLLVLKVVSSAASEPDKKVKYEIVSVNERHGRFRKAVPCMPLALSVLLCLVNMLAPGVGTFMAGLTVLCGCPTEYNDRCTAFFYNILASFLQILTALVVVGWVWSIMWGITFVSISITKKEDDIVAASL